MPTIEGYGFGHVTIDGEELTQDVIILPGRLVRNWRRKDGHGLALEDLADVLDELPEHLIVGIGAAEQLRPGAHALRRLRELGIRVELLPTDQAVRRFGESNPAGTAAALHLTC